VSNSRFRESQMIYTTDHDLAREAMMRPADRKLATELIAGDEDPAHRRVFLAEAYRLGQPVPADVVYRGWWGGTPAAQMAAAKPQQSA
jgi:hypothetical protein